MTRQAYTHHQGVIYNHGKPISPTVAAAQLAAHREGAKACGSWGAQCAARVSAELADQLEHAIKAAERFNAHRAAARQSQNQQRERA